MEQTNRLIKAVKEYREGKQEAFNIVYEESNRYIYACIHRILVGNDNEQDLIADAMQDTYLEISKSIQQLEKNEKFLSWAGMIATSKCYNLVTKNKKYVLQNEEENFDEIPDDLGLIPEELMANKEKQRLIREIIDTQLTPVQRICIVAYYYNEQKQSEIAKQLSIPENTVKTNLSRAKQKLKEAILDLEKNQGTRLYSFTPFLLLLLREEIKNTLTPEYITKNILEAAEKVSTVGAATKAVTEGGEEVIKTLKEGAGVAGTANATGEGAAAGTVGVTKFGTKLGVMSLKAKIVSVAIAVASVGIAGGYVVNQIVREQEGAREKEAEQEGKNHQNLNGEDQNVTEMMLQHEEVKEDFNDKTEEDLFEGTQGNTQGNTQEKPDDKNPEIVDAEKLNIDWKKEYAKIIKPWYEKNHEYHYFGYNLIYMDDDDIPELCLIGELEGFDGIDIYTIDETGVKQIVKDLQCGVDGHRLTYYEKSGYYSYSTFTMSGSFAFYPVDTNSMLIGYATVYEPGVIENQEIPEPVLTYEACEAGPYGPIEQSQTSVKYVDTQGRVHDNTYPAYYELDQLPDAEEIKAFLGIEGFDYPYAKEIYDGAMSYEEICSVLGIEADTTLPDRAVYGLMLKKILNPYLYPNDEFYLEVNLAAIPASSASVFALADINMDGREELLIPAEYYETESGMQYGMINIFSVNEIGVGGYYNFYDPQTGNIASYWGDLCEGIDYYEYKDGKYEKYDYYEYIYSEEWDEELGDYIISEKYIHGIGENVVEISQTEYENQPAFQWEGFSVEWYDINRKNVDRLFTYH